MREQARIQLEGRRSGGGPRHELFLPGPGQPIEPEPRPRVAPGAVQRRPVLRHRGRPVRARRRARLPVRRARHRGRPFTALWSRDATGESTPAGERAAFEAFVDLVVARRDGRPGSPRLPLRGVRADRAQAPRRPLRDARGGGRRAAAWRRVRGPVPGRAPGAPCVGRELLHQEARAALRVRRARSTCAMPARASSSSSVAGAGRGRATGRGAARQDRRATTATTVVAPPACAMARGARVELAARTGPTCRVRPHDRPSCRRTSSRPVRGRDARRATCRPGDHARRRGGALARAARPVAAGPAAGWHRREDKASWWRFSPAHGPHAGASWSTSVSRSAGSSPSGRRTRWTGARATDVALRVPGQEHDLGRRGGSTSPRRKQERPGDSPSSLGRRGELVAIDPVELDLDLRRAAADPHPAAVVPLPIIRTTDHRARLRELGEWVAEHGHRRGRALAGAAATCWPGDRRGRARRLARRCTTRASPSWRRRARLALALDRSATCRSRGHPARARRTPAPS